MSTIGKGTHKTELLVGIFVLFGLALLAGIILRFGSVSENLRPRYTLTVHFKDGSGLRDGTPVRLSGAKVGRVKSRPTLESNLTGVVAVIEIFDDVIIPQDSQFKISTAGLMGDSFVEILPNMEEGAPPLSPNSHLEGSPPGGLDQLQGQLEGVATQLQGGIKDARETIKTLDTTLTNLNQNFLGTKNQENIATSIESLKTSLNNLDQKFLSKENSETLTASLEKLKSASETLDQEIKKLGPTMDKLPDTLEKFNHSVSKIGDAATSFQKTADSLTAVLKEAQTGKGLLPALLRDERLRLDFADLIYNFKERGIIFYRNQAERDRAKMRD